MVLSHAESWLSSQNWLETQGTEGREAIRSAVLELETFGYLKRSVQRGPGGRIIGHRMTWIEEPEEILSEPEADPENIAGPAQSKGGSDQMTGSLLVDNPTCGQSHMRQTRSLRIPSESEYHQKPEHKAAGYDFDFEAASGVQLDLTAPPEIQRLWIEYQGYRKERHHARGRDKLAWTERAARMAAESINHACLNHPEQMVIDRIRTAIEKGWKGLNMSELGKPFTPSQSPHEANISNPARHTIRNQHAATKPGKYAGLSTTATSNPP